MTRRSITTLLAVVLLLLASVAGSGVVAADHNSSIFDDFVDEDDSGSISERVGAKIAGATSWGARMVSARMDDEDANATDHADGFASTYNQNNETIEAYANDQVDASTDYDVFEFHFEDRDGNNVTRYLVADVEDDSYTNSSVMTESEFNETNRTADHWITFDWYQSKNAEEELETFIDEYAEPNESLSNAYKAKLLGKYGAPDSDMWGDD